MNGKSMVFRFRQREGFKAFCFNLTAALSVTLYGYRKK
jgi:hypothetical protein